MNKETLSRKVTLDLSSRASSGEHDYNIKDAEDVIDDILSCSQLEFLGSTTRKFTNKKNPKDSRNDKMCTIPVRMEFKDKEIRKEAEISLRKICKVSCAVPYPKKLRAIMDRMVQDGKKKHPGCYIRTKVNVDSLTVKAFAKTGEGWVDLNTVENIPLSILEQVTNDTAMDVTVQIS
jgi:hypothetical protein